MNLLKCVIVTILYCLGEICKGQGVFISKEETKWDESNCTLAEPIVTCRDYESCIVENGLEILTNADDQDNGFWIGYAKTWISFAYVGCDELDGEVEYSVSTLGECRRTTGCKTFGIQKSTAGLQCKCARKSASPKQTCGETCVEADHYPCGGTADTKIYSFYTVENVPPSEYSQDTHRNCLLFYYHYSSGSDYYWDRCIAVNSPALLCSKKYFSDNSTNPPLMYAYVELINQTFYVRFEGDSNKWRKSLCLVDTPPTQAPALDASTTSISHQVPEGTPASLDKDEGGSTSGLAAGLSVSLVVLSIVTVIVLVLLKRRGLLTKCYTQKDGKENHNEDTRTEISFVSTPIFESTTNTTHDLTASNHSYFVLEKTFNRETKEETEHYAEPDTTDVDHYDLTEMSQKHTNDDYDTTDGKKGPAKSGIAKPNNNYNKVTLHQSNEYDHIHQNGRPPKSDRQNENEYDLSNNLIDGKPNDNFGEDSDTYNHLNKHESKSSGTDNVYGKSETDGDSGYDTSSALKPRMNVDANDQQADYAVIKKKW